MKNGEFLKLTPKTFDVLQLLVEKRGEIATKDEILGKVWNGSIVEEGNLPVHIRKLRSLLGENNGDRFIETVQGTGYRFVSSVSDASESEWFGAIAENGHRERKSGLEAVEPISSQNFESQKYYKKGKYLAEKRAERTLYMAIACFEKSVRYDPGNVLSWVELVETYLALYCLDRISHREILKKIAPSLPRISALDKDVAVVHAMYGGIKLYLEWKIVEAAQHIKRALELDPDCLVALARYQECLICSGKLAEAIAETEKYLKIDPFSVLTYKRVARLLWKTGDIERAIPFLEDVLAIEPSDLEAPLILGAFLAELGRLDEALPLLEKSGEIDPNDEVLATIACVHAKAGRREEAIRIRDRLKDSPNPHFTNLARLCVALGEIDEAFANLDAAVQNHELDLIALRADTRFDGIREERRFYELLERMGI